MRERQKVFVEGVRECEEVREMKWMKKKGKKEKETVGNHWEKKDKDVGTYLMAKLHVV